MSLKDTERLMYLATRTVGDVDAAQHGRLGRRVTRRVVRREVTGPISDGLWSMVLGRKPRRRGRR